jgi:hypothetical protein
LTTINNNTNATSTFNISASNLAIQADNLTTKFMVLAFYERVRPPVIENRRSN